MSEKDQAGHGVEACPTCIDRRMKIERLTAENERLELDGDFLMSEKGELNSTLIQMRYTQAEKLEVAYREGHENGRLSDYCGVSKPDEAWLESTTYASIQVTNTRANDDDA